MFNVLSSFIRLIFSGVGKVGAIIMGEPAAVEEDCDVTVFMDDQENIHEVWESINRMRANNQLCDAVLVVDKKRFPVHKAILAANSEYFRALFTNGMKESKESDIQMSCVNQEMIALILEYIYARKVQLTAKNVVTLLPTADSLAMPGLLAACCDFLRGQLSPKNCVGIMEFAERYNCLTLVSEAKRYILNNFLHVATQSTEFLELDVQELAGMISDDHLNVYQEEEVFEAIIRWIDYAAKDRVKSIAGLLLFVRLGLVRPNYFLDYIGGHNYIKDNDACAEIIQRAWDVLYSIERTGKDTVVRTCTPWVRPRIPREVVFAIGGWSGGAPIAIFETYDARAERWFTHSTLEDDSPRAYHGMVQIDKMIYMVGGFDGQKYYNSMRRFEAVSGEWEEVAPMHVHRCYVSAVHCEGYVYACGGYDGRWRLDVAERYDPTTNQWTMMPPMKSKRSDSGADAHNGKVYIVGGFDGEQCLDSVDVFDPVTSQWSLLERRMDVRRSGVSAISHGGYLYALGGFDGERRLDTGERYCLETGRWTPIPDMLAARSNFAVVVLENNIYCIGGFNGSHTISQVESFSQDSNSWNGVMDMNVNRSALKACVICDLPNAVDYTHHGHERRKTQDDVSGDDLSGGAASTKVPEETEESIDMEDSSDGIPLDV